MDSKVMTVLLVGIGMVVGGRIFAKINTIDYLGYKLKSISVKKQPFYKYLTSIPLNIAIDVENGTNESLPFKGFTGTVGMANIEPVPFRVVGTGSILNNATTELKIAVNVASGTLIDAIASAMAGKIPTIAEIEGNLYIGRSPIKVKASVNIIESLI